VDGRFGVAYLVVGFAVQGIGYLLDLALDPDTDASVARAAVAGGVGLVCGGGGYLLWKRQRRKALTATLIEMAHYDGNKATTPAIRGNLPHAKLFDWAHLAGISSEELGVSGAVHPPRERR
jgi:hypothetical protein